MSKFDLQALSDLEEIRNLPRRYAHCIWQKDVDGVVDLFTEDGVMDFGDRPPLHGRKELLESYTAMTAGPEFLPFIANHLIELDGDRATGTCYLDLRATMEGRSMIGAGFYDDAYARVDGEWKFSSRTMDVRFFEPITEGWAEANTEE